jgi:hypothetical protein
MHGHHVIAVLMLCVLAALPARAEDAVWADARVSTVAQIFSQGLVPGQPGAVTRIEPAYPFTTTGFMRFGGVDLPNARDSVSGELSAWGRVGPRDGLLGDGDVTSAWVQFKQEHFRVKLGRQVTLPGSSRYVRFDGAALGVSFGVFDLDVYGGWVALPRWNQPRGAQYLGFVGDALKDPLYLEAQNRLGQFVAGARAGTTFGRWGRASLAFHEQHDSIGVAFRVLSADVVVRPAGWLQLGGRVSFDAVALAVPEARVFADITALRVLPISIDYSFQQPSLLLPKTSVLAAFGGGAWHELGAETRVQLPASLVLTLRGAGQLFEKNQLGGRGTARLQWTPGLDGRWLVLGEVSRAWVPPSGFTQLRVAARWKATRELSASADAAIYFYDTAIRGTRLWATGIASLEYRVSRWVSTMISGTVMTTPYAAFEAQGLARIVMELDPVSAGGGT